MAQRIFVRVRTFVLSAVGIDRPGIIAGVARVLHAHGVNVADSQMAILRGHFTMTLVVTAPEGLDYDALASDVAGVGDELGLEAIGVRPVEDAHALRQDSPDFVVGVYGADHPGILAAVTAALAGMSANVCNLRTRLLGEESGSPIYVLVMEVALHEGRTEDELRAALEAVGAQEGVEVSVNPLEADVL